VRRESRVSALCLAAIVLVIASAPAHAYEFWLRAMTYGQAYELREYRLVGPDLFLGRRRFTQTLALRIWDIGDFSAERRRSRLPDRGLRISWRSYLRIDHDFGLWSSGRIKLSEQTRRDAIDVIPELAESIAGLQLLYGHFTFEGIADDRVTLEVGRLLVDDGWGTSGVDGASANVLVPSTPVAVTVSGGLRVRAASPLGLSAFELDGTSGAGCREYVEAANPGEGTWKLIDRDRTIEAHRLASDYEYCPQREELQPTVGVTIASVKRRGFAAELGYRRTWSSTVGVFGDVDRLQFPDKGLYPNDFGQAPSSGVNEEHVHVRAQYERGRVRPFASARYSLLHAVLDRADAGVELVRGKHSLEPKVEYFYPTFDGDSIFNVFSIEPATDARIGYRYDGAVRAYANAWLRRYSSNHDAYAGGADASVERDLTSRLRARVDALWDDGYGGRRVGGSGEAGWRPTPNTWLRGRAIVLGVAPDDGRPRYVTTSIVLSSSHRIGDAAALHFVGESDYDDRQNGQLRALAVLDLAFAPEP
jgi:hypothetical protein